MLNLAVYLKVIRLETASASHTKAPISEAKKNDRLKLAVIRKATSSGTLINSNRLTKLNSRTPNPPTDKGIAPAIRAIDVTITQFKSPRLVPASAAKINVITPEVITT